MMTYFFMLGNYPVTPLVQILLYIFILTKEGKHLNGGLQIPSILIHQYGHQLAGAPKIKTMMKCMTQ